MKYVVAFLVTFLTTILMDGPVEARKHHASYLHQRQHHHHIRHHRNTKVKHHHRQILAPIVVADISISSQTMSVRVNGGQEGYWRVSTARQGYSTPRGAFRPTRMARVYFSKKYDNSPMPYSVFFYGGNAIHGTTHIGGLGRPASHGCIRLHPNNAARFFNLIERYGRLRTRINIH